MNKTGRYFPYILFIVWPFLSLFYAIVNYKSRYFKNIVWFFSAFFGFTFVISSEGIDAAVYRDKFIATCNDPNIEFYDHVLNEGATDFFINFINFFLSQITNDYRFLFLVYGMLFGYFYSRNIGLLLDYSKNKINRYTWLPLLLFVFLVPFWNINGIRFYLATHIFLFGTFSFFLTKQKKYLLFILAAPYVHFSFWICAAILSIYLLLGIRRWGYVLLLFIGFFVYQPEITTILQYVPQMDGAAQEKLEGYTFHEYLDNLKETKANASWFLFLRNDLLNYSLLLFSLYLTFFKFSTVKKSGFAPILMMGMLFLGVGKLLVAFPLIERFWVIGYLFYAAFLFLYTQTIGLDYWMKRIIALTAFPFVLFVSVEIRIGIDVISPGIFYTNPLVAPYIEYKTPLSTFYE